MEKIFEDLIIAQKDKLLKYGRRIVPHITQDDLLQPNDFPALENHPVFRHEEGVLEGLMSAQMAYLSWQADLKSKISKEV